MDISEPTLLLNENICKANIQRMAEKAQRHNLAFKPHMKTHQTAEVGEWLKEAGVKSITVSSILMAEYFASQGWDDITVAFPANIRQAENLNKLAAKVDLTLLINSPFTAKKLNNQLTNSINAYIELDTGSERTGLKVEQEEQIKEIIDTINAAQNLNWIGFYSHPGHSYDSTSEKEIQAVHQSVLSQLNALRNNFNSEYGDFEVCIGDTPCCSKGNSFDGIDAISPGNFVFYDLMQHKIGSCEIKDIAVAVICPIVDKLPTRKELAVHGGAIHFSKEKMQEKGIIHFGKSAIEKENHWQISDSESYLKALSQEHGIVECSDDDFDSYQVGDLITILPVHSCLTANLMDSYRLKNGDIIHQL